jgi:hypothetical protein
MQDLPKGVDQQWLKNAKKHIQWAQKEVSKENKFLEELLSQIELVVTENYQMEFSSKHSETD